MAKLKGESVEVARSAGKKPSHSSRSVFAAAIKSDSPRAAFTKPWRGWLAAGLGAILLVEFIFFAHGGLGRTLFWLGAIGIYFLIYGRKNFGGRNLTAIILIFLLSLPFCLFNDSTLNLIDTLALAALTVSLFIMPILDGKNWDRLAFYVNAIVVAIGGWWVSLADPWRELKNRPAKSDASKIMRRRLIRQAVVGVIAALALLAILGGLLAASDQIFSRNLGNLLRPLAHIQLWVIGQILLMLVVLPFVLSAMWSYRKAAKLDFKTPSQKRRPRLPNLTAIIILSFVNLLYIFYAVIQFKYLFGGASYWSLAGMTYADYARRGFFELTVVAAINVALAILTIKLTTGKSRVLRILSLLLIVLAAVQLASAFTRMNLYVQAYGLSQQRVFIIALMILLAMAFVILILREFLSNFPLFKPIVLSGFAVLICLNFAAPDALIARYNISHYLSGQIKTSQLDLNYLWKDLSVDSAAVVLQNQSALAKKNPALGRKIQTYRDQLGDAKTPEKYCADTAKAINRGTMSTLQLDSGVAKYYGYLSKIYCYDGRYGQGEYYTDPSVPQPTGAPLSGLSWKNWNLGQSRFNDLIK
ncbi:MAG: DUF4173 domain-containing protein [Candidatus Nomurabacteria bacterium]|jgi:hypothetical protein|nr:DUF4173 domain-containing protein [Candidatus Nomurabacteria bacterium]